MKTNTKLCLVTIVCLVQLFSCQKDKSNPDHPQDTTDSGMIAWYTFDNDVLDHSGNNNNVISNSAIPAIGKNGKEKTAYKFDGSGSYMQVANSALLNPPVISLYALVKPEGFYQGRCHGNRILSKGYNDYEQGRIDLGFDDAAYYSYTGCDAAVQNNFQNFYGSFGNGVNATGANDLTQHIQANQWYSLVYTYDGISSKLYVNGILVNQVQGSTTFYNNTNHLFIGRNQDPGYPYYFNGVIDEIRIYNRVLSQDEVERLHNKN